MLVGNFRKKKLHRDHLQSILKYLILLFQYSKACKEHLLICQFHQLSFYRSHE